MLSGAQQHPDLFSRLTFENAGERGAASRAGVVLLDLSVFHCAGADPNQRLAPLDRRRLSVKISTRRTGLNPKFQVGTPEAHTEKEEMA